MKSLNFKKAISGLMLSILGLTSHACFAGSATGNMLVSATVVNACLIVPGPMAFGNYDPTATSATTATATVLVTCTLSDNYTVGLGNGSGTGATSTLRKMTSATGTATLNYEIFSDAAHTQNWDATNTVTGSGSGLVQTLTAYGLIPPQQGVAAGAYTDTVVATINY